MEGVSASVYKGLRGYWRRRGYKKLSGNGNGKKRRRVWRRRIKLAPKLKLRIRRFPSPKKFLVWLRDAYVNLMMRFANSRVFTTSYGGHGGSFGTRPLKEYDDRIIIDIYKSLMLSRPPRHPPT